MLTVDDTEITFVVQGPLSTGVTSTDRCLRSIREHFPDSRVVLSTWPGSDVHSLSYDELVVSPDPGPIASDFGELRLTNNVNRQVESTAAGLGRVNTPYSVKLRSDALITGRGFLGFSEAFPWRAEEFSVFSQRVVISSEFTRSPGSFIPMAFHPSDLFQFGRTDDLKRFWNVEQLSGRRLEDFQLSTPPTVWFTMFDRFRYTTEQYLFLEFLKREGRTVQLRDYGDIDGEIPQQSQDYLLNNFLPVEPELLGVRHAKFARRAHRSLLEDCIGIREFTSWYVAELTGLGTPNPIGRQWPKMSRLLRAERVAREFLKRIPLLRHMYADRYLAR